MVALAECLEDHGDDINLLYLMDSEAILQAIHRWIGCGAKLNLSKAPDADVLKRIIIKLQKRVLAGAVTLLIKVKAHRGDPLNEEPDIRAEMGRHKAIQEVGWNDPTNRTGRKEGRVLEVTGCGVRSLLYAELPERPWVVLLSTLLHKGSAGRLQRPPTLLYPR